MLQGFLRVPSLSGFLDLSFHLRKEKGRLRLRRSDRAFLAVRVRRRRCLKSEESLLPSSVAGGRGGPLTLQFRCRSLLEGPGFRGLHFWPKKSLTIKSKVSVPASSWRHTHCGSQTSDSIAHASSFFFSRERGLLFSNAAKKSSCLRCSSKCFSWRSSVHPRRLRRSFRSFRNRRRRR